MYLLVVHEKEGWIIYLKILNWWMHLAFLGLVTSRTVIDRYEKKDDKGLE